MPLGSLVIFISSLFIIGFGPIMMLVNNPQFFDPESGSVIGGNNMAAIHLSQAVGGQVFLGFISAVAFATILVVVSGLTLSGASAISHNIYASVIRNGNMQSGEELKVSRVATILLGIAAIFLGIIFEKQNVAYMVGLALAIAASANFPILFLSVYWQKLTTRGAFVGNCIGSLTAITCMLLGPTIWVDILDHAEPIFPYKHPALFSMMAAFAFILLFSKMDTSASAEAEATAFEDQYVRSQTGLGAEGASQH